jgi:hypothetical protein
MDPVRPPIRRGAGAALPVAWLALALCTALALAPAAWGDGLRWPAGTPAYKERIPGDRWALDRAVQAWNTSGAAIRFVRTGSPVLADVVVAYGALPGGSVGQAQVGFSPRQKAFVRIAPPSRRRFGLDRYAMAAVLAHELGHVLGLGHGGSCSVMATSLDAWIGASADCRPAPRGWWRCRLLSRADVRRAVALYGGVARQSGERRWCPR